MAKLTEQDREEIIANLTDEGSDGPWGEDDQDFLANLDDEKLISLDEYREATVNCQAAAEAALTGFRDSEGNSHVYNSETGQWESRIKPRKKEPPQIVNTPPSQMTEEEWFAAAPESVKSVLNEATARMEQEKKQLIGQILSTPQAKTMDADRLKKITANLWNEDLDSLKDRVALLPKPEHQLPNPARFVGSSQVPTPVGNAIQDEYDRTDFLPLPKLDFSQTN